ncbi:MAG: hypothetical protein K2I52_04275, partial [Muribaculaceae bacterium]|nr:hypothetical protein [Muribaculaceae bacterium]
DIIKGDRPGNEDWPTDPENPDKPDVPVPPVPEDCISFDGEGTTLDTKDGNENRATEYGQDIKDAIVVILAEHGLSNLRVTINSVGLDEDELEAIGLPKSFDLAYPENDEISEALTILEFPIKEDVIGKTSVEFDITQFVPLLPNFEGPHEFVIEAVDAQGHTKSLTLKFVNE